MVAYGVEGDVVTPVTVHVITRQQIRYREQTEGSYMNKPRMIYFEEQDVLHLVLTSEPEVTEPKLSPNITAELTPRRK